MIAESSPKTGRSRPEHRAHWSGGYWFPLPKSWLTQAYLGNLTAAEIRVLLVISRCANYISGIAHPSINSIAEVTGSGKRIVERAIKNLIAFGIIRQLEAGGGRGRTNVYQPVESPGPPSNATESRFMPCPNDRHSGPLLLHQCNQCTSEFDPLDQTSYVTPAGLRWVTGPWLALPQSWVDRGELNHLSKSELLVLLALASFADFSTGNAYPGLDRVTAMTDVIKRNAQRAIKRLKLLGVITLVKKSHGLRSGIANQYQFAQAIPDQSLLLSEHKTPVGRTIKPRHSEPEKAPKSCINPGGTTTPSEEQKTDQQQKQSAAAGDKSEEKREIVNTLLNAGIGEPKRSELARLPGITVNIAESETSKAKERGKGTGIVIMNIETAASANVKRQEEMRKTEARHEEQRIAERVASDDRTPEGQQKHIAFIDVMSKAELDQAIQSLMKIVQPQTKERWQHETPDYHTDSRFHAGIITRVRLDPSLASFRGPDKFLDSGSTKER